MNFFAYNDLFEEESASTCATKLLLRKMQIDKIIDIDFIFLY